MILIVSRDCSQVEVDTAQLRGLELSRASVHAAEQRMPKSICSVAEGNGRAPDLLIAAEVVPLSSTAGSSQYLYIPFSSETNWAVYHWGVFLSTDSLFSPSA